MEDTAESRFPIYPTPTQTLGSDGSLSEFV